MPVFGAMAENATLFVTYNQAQQALIALYPYDTTKSAPLAHLATAGVAAGVATSFVLTPIELIKCRMQVQMIADGRQQHIRNKLPGPIGITSEILRERGVKGLWLGQTGTFLREAGGSMAWFLGYEYAVRALVHRRQQKSAITVTKHHLSTPERMLAGAAAGAAYTVILFPADTVKSTMQTAALLDRPSNLVDANSTKGFLQTGREMFAAKGWRGLYSGCGVTIVKSAGSSAIIFSIYAFLESVSECKMLEFVMMLIHEQKFG